MHQVTKRKITTEKTGENHSIDARYKLLFSQPEIVEDLVRYAIDEKLADSLNFSTFKAEPTHWVSARMKHARSSDSIFSLNFKSGEPVFLILMLEFQSTPDAYMAVRSSLYTLLFYESLTKKKNHPLVVNDKLPAVLPIVLYNGDAPWHYPTELFDLIALPPKSLLKAYQPKQQFFLVNEKQMKDKMQKSLTQALFMLEFIQNDHEFEQFFIEFPAFLKRIAPNRKLILKELFAAYLGGIFSENGQVIPESLIAELLGSKRMLAKNLKKILDDKEQIGLVKGRQEGRQEGKQEGRQEGKQEGAREARISMLTHILAARFHLKALPDWAIKTIQAAPARKIEQWAVKETKGKTLKEFLK